MPRLESRLNPGIISVLQTPFDAEGHFDSASMGRLVEDAIQSGVNGFLVPAVASEVAFLTEAERFEIVRLVANVNAKRVPIILGASAYEASECQKFASLTEEIEAAAWLVAVPGELYEQPDRIVPFFQEVSSATETPLIIQDLQWNGSGLNIAQMEELQQALPTLDGIKIETVPAGPKYTAVRERFGDDFFIAGGWAVPQWIEALDRGVDAMIPETAMIPVYAAILNDYQTGNRARALDRFRRLLPVLTFTNQEIGLSIAFFKRLLVRRGIFKHDTMRLPGFTWDRYNDRIANELIELYFELENEFGGHD
ncbi:L-2-keto-3-deoxyarabonate dehydratase [Polystyrenella longa]|uniref:L-2-keto-3-deoxyarabonate dehydratase n=1 Tax=Polystyrenella longa TaxID=2528007 RepID=A0A518CUG9_9PLAN|nr:dihydrodipicolinate synthase family protein [Polystyrenella longa]QDU82879.1 L-2-keto-3-deoxyarabonate dehydratase [Polystyrenella longa]